MQSNHNNGKNSGKEPENPTVQVPQSVYDILCTLDLFYSEQQLKDIMENMILYAMQTYEADGKIGFDFVFVNTYLNKLFTEMGKHFPESKRRKTGLIAA